MEPVIWIVLGVVAVLVIVALIALTVRNSNRRKLTEAAELRREAKDREQTLERGQAVAREQQHRAAAAEEEARAKAAEAEKLRVDADRHRDAVAEQERDVARMERTADELDPRRRGDRADSPRHAESVEAAPERPGEARGAAEGVTARDGSLRDGSPGVDDTGRSTL